jgi:hypothetical protein
MVVRIFLFLALWNFSSSYGQLKKDSLAETLQSLLDQTPILKEDHYQWTYTFESYDATAQLLKIRETLRHKDNIETERVSPIQKSNIKNIKIVDAPESLKNSFACSCNLHFKERINQKVIFYEDGVEYEAPDFLSIPFKTKEACKAFKKKLKRLKFIN